MGQYLIFIAVISVISSQSSSFPLDSDWNNPSRNASVCSYKGRDHTDGEVINVDEPCLLCRCKKGALTCGLRICTDVPDPPPRNCYIVHNTNQCCPQMVCHVEEKDSDIEVRTVYGPQSSSDVCVVNGNVYAEGSALESTDKCEYCYCIRGQQKCIKPKCAMPFEGCKPIYTQKSCCPTQYDCRDQRTDVTYIQGKNLGCEIDGVVYAEGAMLSGNDSNCETCYCMKGQVRCISVTCETEFTDDCEPVYKPGQCCPTSYTCSKTIVETPENSVSSFSKRLKSQESSDEKTDGDTTVTKTEPTTESTMTTSDDLPDSTTLVVDIMKSKVDAVETRTETGLQKNISETTTEVTTYETEESTMLFTSPSILPVTDTESRNLITSPTENRTEESTSPVPLLEDIYSSSPQMDDDYDSYDYNEPRLPPSLPNLIIFPFVAADAVVKDEETTKSVTYDVGNIKRVGTETPFYKDFFSPPAKIEGGFIPKRPPAITDIYQEYSAKDGAFPRPDIIIPSVTVPPKTHSDQCIVKGHLHEHGELLSEPGECQSCICYYGNVICHEVVCPPLRQGCRRSPEKDVNSCCGKIICDKKDTDDVEGGLDYHRTAEKMRRPDVFQVTANPFREKTEPTPDIPLLMADLVPIYTEHQTKKPVTVTYKNLIVDYYPDFLITTTRDDVRKKNYKTPIYITTEIQPLTVRPETSAENVTYPTQPTVTSSISDDLEGEHSKYPYGKVELVRTSVRPIITVGTQPSRLFDYYTVEEYKPKEQVTRRTRPPRPMKKTTETSVVDDHQYTPSVKSTNSVKHKYSTKTKSKTSTTAQYRETQTKSTVEKNTLEDSFSLDSVLRFFFNTETTTPVPTARPTTTRKTTKKDSVKKFTTNPTEERVRQTTRGTSPDYKYKENPSTADSDDVRKKYHSDAKKSAIGGLLKLAGCNIYGRMYRVGKIITELSNPCLECVCTDFGVECNPLLC